MNVEPGCIDIDMDRACEVMHDAYEKAAKGSGWETNPASRVAWKDVPLANKKSMTAAVKALIDFIAAAKSSTPVKRK